MIRDSNHWQEGLMSVQAQLSSGLRAASSHLYGIRVPVARSCHLLSSTASSWIKGHVMVVVVAMQKHN